jgi:hypothetical protein
MGYWVGQVSAELSADNEINSLPGQIGADEMHQALVATACNAPERV